MKTYPSYIIIPALMSVVDKNKYIKFSYYNDFTWLKHVAQYRDKLINKPSFVKGKIQNIMCSPKGLLFFMDPVWLGNSKGNKIYYHHNRAICFEARNMRWETFPFDWNKIEETCRQLIKKLPESTSGRVLIPIPESTNTLKNISGALGAF